MIFAKVPQWFRAIRCRMGDHRYSAIRQLSWTSQKLQCIHCNKLFVINHDLRVVLPWDDSFEKLYRQLDAIKRGEAP